MRVAVPTSVAVPMSRHFRDSLFGQAVVALYGLPGIAGGNFSHESGKINLRAVMLLHNFTYFSTHLFQIYVKHALLINPFKKNCIMGSSGGSTYKSSRRAPPPEQDQILSFLHMFSPKSTCVGGWRPLQRGLAPPNRKSWIRPWEVTSWPKVLLTG